MNFALSHFLLNYFYRWFYYIIILFCLLIFLSNSHSVADEREEKIFTAAVFYIVKFSRSDEWNKKAKLRLCSYSSNVNITKLLKDHFSKGLHLGKRVIITDSNEHCDIMYFAEDYGLRDTKNVLLSIKGTNILAIGHHELFLEYGGVVLLREENNKLRIFLNEEVVKSRKLRFSSEFLAIVQDYKPARRKEKK